MKKRPTRVGQGTHPTSVKRIGLAVKKRAYDDDDDDDGRRTNGHG